MSADMNSNLTILKDAHNALVTGSNELAGGISIGGSLTIASGGLTVTAGVLSQDDATDTTSGVTGSIHTDGGLGVAKALWVATTSQLVGITTHGGNVVSDTDSTDDLGTNTVRWANLYVDDITVTTGVSASTLTGTLQTAAQPNVTSLGTLAANLIFADATHDIGASGATRPRNLFLSGAIVTVGDLSLDGDLDFVGAQAITTTAGDLTLNPSGAVACGSNNFTGMGTLGCGVITTVGDLSLDGDLDFLGAQAITTTAGDLTLNPSGNVACGSNAFTGMGALSATTGTFSGVIKTDDTTDATSTTAAALQSDGGVACALDAWIGAQLNVVGTGPHAMGVAANAAIQLDIGGTLSAGELGCRMNPVLGPVSAGADAMVLSVQGTIEEGTSGTHADFIGLRIIPPTITAGDAALTNASSLKITGAPSGASNNYALWVDDGSVQIDLPGPHAIGNNQLDHVRLGLRGNFLSLGGAAIAVGLLSDGRITAADGDVTYLVGTSLQNSLLTQTATESITLAAQLRVADPIITDQLGGAGVITDATVLFLGDAPSEGATNTIILTAQGANLTTGGVWTDGPSYRGLKDNIELLEGVRLRVLINDLEPVTFAYKDSGALGLHVVVEDYGAVMTRHGILNHNSGSDGIASAHLATVALAGVKDHEPRIAELEAEIKLLKAV